METRLLIRGEQVAGDGEALAVENPATEETIATVGLPSADQLDAAVAAAEEAFPVWAGTPAVERAELLHEVAARMRARTDELARAMTRQRRHVPRPAAFTMTADTGMPSRSSAVSSACVSADGSAAGRVTTTNAVRAGSVNAACSLRSRFDSCTRSAASVPAPTISRYFTRMAISACVHSRSTAGVCSRRSAWPVGAVSVTMTS